MTALNGDQAVRAIQENLHNFHKYNTELTRIGGQSQQQPTHFDAIILDLNMPIMNGYEACKQIV